MLKKKAVGTLVLETCEECRTKTKVLYDKDGKKVCKKCLDKGGK
jgi:hypothetical protein